ncbi:MAG: hypothetical protein SFW65_02950 [Alphaproteobacteria bacterium]|nr:hypothetical protein [Alphaproteobacteria bacterium]
MWKPPTKDKKTVPKKVGTKKAAAKPAPKKPVELPKIEINKDQLFANVKRIGLKYAKNPLVWVGIVSAIAYLAVEMPAWERKSNFYEVVRSGRAGYLCLSHENSVFERSGMTKPFNTTKSYLRFDRGTFIKDFLKRDETSLAFLAVAVDLNGGVYWSEMTEKENAKLSKQFKIDLGTCLAAPNTHFTIPGVYFVTNQ